MKAASIFCWERRVKLKEVWITGLAGAAMAVLYVILHNAGLLALMPAAVLICCIGVIAAIDL